MVKILIKKTNNKVITPCYKTEGSSGVDLSAFLDKKVVIKPNSSELIPTGLQVAIPEDLEIQIRPRSGLAAKESIGVLNSPGTIDSDYRGELKIILFNSSFEIPFGVGAIAKYLNFTPPDCGPRTTFPSPRSSLSCEFRAFPAESHNS